jgi:hypothetical protein
VKNLEDKNVDCAANDFIYLAEDMKKENIKALACNNAPGSDLKCSTLLTLPINA